MQKSQPLKNGEHERFAIAINQSRVADCPIETIKGVLRMIMLKVGIRAANLPGEEEKAVLLNHVLTEYAGHTPEEILLAFDMAITGKLDVDANSYESFSCLYFSKIMNAYREWARQEYAQLKAAKTEEQKQLVYSIDPKKELLELIEMYRVDLHAGRLRAEYVLPSVFDSLLKFELIKNPVNITTIEDKRQAVIEYLKSGK